MNDFKIKEEAYLTYENNISEKRAFINGAKSNAAKEYWQQGMYTAQDMKAFTYKVLQAFLNPIEKRKEEIIDESWKIITILKEKL
ncbi:MAG: hypothetical protein WC827_03580 [Candidatus Paceibacterota bacterium]|jgi:tryptophanyl-tRNA synthetase